MQHSRRILPDTREILFFTFNVSSIRRAWNHHLLSKEFLVGLALWGISVAVVLLHIVMNFPVPTFLLAIIAIFSVFLGCCWVALPVFVYLQMKMHRQLRRTLRARRFLRFVTGISLWQQAVRGRLPLQFLGTLVVGAWLAFLAFAWPMAASWQVLFLLAFFVDVVFFIFFPLLLFLGWWVRRGMRWEVPR